MGAHSRIPEVVTSGPVGLGFRRRLAPAAAGGPWSPRIRGQATEHGHDMRSAQQFRTLLFRMDGAADSRKVRFESPTGRTWEAEFCLYVGDDPQAGRLKILFRCVSAPLEPQRYNEAPPGISKSPDAAVREVDEAQLRELLATSVRV